MEAATQEINTEEVEKITFKIASGMNKRQLQKEIDRRIDIVIKDPNDEISKIEAKVFAETLLRRTS
jgi:hypothetical protein